MLGKITINDIENSLCSLDTEYREALAHCLMNKKYLSDSPLRLEMGTEKQQAELEKVWNKSLKPKQIREIINYISNEMRGDFQFGSYVGIAKNYLALANELEKQQTKSIKDRITKCNLVEIYDKKSDVVIIRFVANKKSSVEKQVIKAMEQQGFKIWLQGTISPTNRDLYWLASNKDYHNLHLSYREKEVNKKDLGFDPKGFTYTGYSKKLNQKYKDLER